MATTRWLGGAPAVAQVNTWTFAGTFLANETVTFAYGGVSWVYTLTSGTIATFLPLLEAAYNALSETYYPQFAEQTADSTATTLTLTADTPGKPFTVTVSTDSVSGTINGGSSSTGTATTASSGPNDWSTAANWSAGAVPGADDVIVDDPTWPIYYGLAQSAVTLTSLSIPAKFSGSGSRIGLPRQNADGSAYPEYRNDYLTVSVTTLTVGRGDGDGAERIKLNVGANACTADVYKTASGIDDDGEAEALLFKGTSASNVLRVHGGAEVGVAVYGGETANLSGGVTVNPGGWLRCGSGTTLGAVTNNGGGVELNSAIATSLTHTALGGSTVVYGAGAVAQLTLRGGYCAYCTSGTLGGNTLLTGNAVLDFDQDVRGKTVTNPVEIQSDSATVLDNNFVVNAGSNLVLDFNHCSSKGLGANVRLTRAATA